MKSIILKINKVISLIKRNGFFSSLKIVGGYLNTYLKSFFVGSGDVLFVTSGVGDKAHFRAYGVAEELETHGFKCSVTMSDNFNLVKLSKKFKVFVLHKISWNEKIAKFISEIKKRHGEIIFDTDDLDFDPKYLKDVDFFSKISETEKKEYEKGIGAEIINDPYVKVATTTVSYLAEKIREKGKKVFIVSNKISNGELEIANNLLEKGKTKDEFLRLGYFSGTPSHDKDFATISDALIEVLRKNENVKLLLAGPLNTDDKLQEFESRIEILPRVSREKYYANIFKCDINLIPLEMNDPFCESKSELKFFETGILCIPTVAVRNQTYSEAIEDGVSGFLASGKEEWIEKIEKLLQDEKLRLEMGKSAREKVLKDYTNKNSHSEEYYEYLKSCIMKHKT